MLDAFLDTFDDLEILALGEPAHGEPAFPRWRNAMFERLAARGFRSIAVESDRIAGLAADAYVRGEGTAPAGGFSHGLGALDANRELLEWMRAYNAAVPPAGRLSFHGFDTPLEMTHAPSPGPYLRYVRDHLGTANPDIDRLVGDDGRWSDPAALMDAGHSPGRTWEATTLRGIADDLLAAVYLHAPECTGGWQRARLHAMTAIGLLRYHAACADPLPPAERTERLLGLRDAWMAEILLDIRAVERRRGPTLVFAHNRHVQRQPSTWRLAGMDLVWPSAGRIVSALLGRRYAVVAGSLGASAALGLGAPAAGTYEAALTPGLHQGRTVSGGTRTDMTPEQGYFPLDAETVAHSDAVWHIDAP